MKRIFAILVCLISVNISAQTYYPFQTSITNPNWSEAFWIGPGDSPDFFWYEINTDTIIGIETYGKVESFTTGGSFYEGALRENNFKQVVFIPKDSTSEMVIYDFSKQLNDTLVNIWCYNTGDWKQDTLIITMVDSILLGSNYFNRFYLQNINEMGGVEWIESIGSTRDLLRHRTYLSVSGDIYLTCFHNNASLNYTTSQPMGWIGSGTCYLMYESFESKNVSVYPNPASNYLLIESIDLLTNSSYEIININGQIVQQGKVNSNILQLDILNQGLFMIRFKSETGQYFAKFIKT